MIFLCGVAAVAVLETHRTAGAAYNLARHMAAIQAGHYSIRLSLRKGDNLQTLEESFNDMSRALQARALCEVETLESLAATCENLSGPDECLSLATQIRHRADDMPRHRVFILQGQEPERWCPQ